MKIQHRLRDREGNDILKAKATGEGIITKVVPFQKRIKNRKAFGLTVTVKDNNEYARFDVFEPYTNVIVKGQKIKFEGTLKTQKKYGENLFVVLDEATVTGKTNNLAYYGYQLSLFE